MGSTGLKLLPQVTEGRKRCLRCQRMKRWNIENKYTSEFYVEKRRLKSGVVRFYPKSECKECANARVAEWREKERAEGRLSERQHQWNKRRDTQRTQLLRKERRSFDAERQSKPVRTRQLEDTRQIREDNTAFLEWLDEYKALTGTSDRYIARALEARFGISNGDRRLRAVCQGQERVTIDFVDKIGVALDQPFLVSLLYPMDD